MVCLLRRLLNDSFVSCAIIQLVASAPEKDREIHSSDLTQARVPKKKVVITTEAKDILLFTQSKTTNSGGLFPPIKIVVKTTDISEDSTLTMKSYIVVRLSVS